MDTPYYVERTVKVQADPALALQTVKQAIWEIKCAGERTLCTCESVSDAYKIADAMNTIQRVRR
jgi:hypothetical protein